MKPNPLAVYAFAGLYVVALTLAWLLFDPPRVTNGDYFAQFALVLTAIGLYHSESPKR